MNDGFRIFDAIFGYVPHFIRSYGEAPEMLLTILKLVDDGLYASRKKECVWLKSFTRHADSPYPYHTCHV
jgi:hypothetical protein